MSLEMPEEICTTGTGLDSKGLNRKRGGKTREAVTCMGLGAVAGRLSGQRSALSAKQGGKWRPLVYSITRHNSKGAERVNAKMCFIGSTAPADARTNMGSKRPRKSVYQRFQPRRVSGRASRKKKEGYGGCPENPDT